MYALVVGKGGPKLQKADIEEKDCAGLERSVIQQQSGPPSLTKALLPAQSQQPCHAIGGGRGSGLRGRAANMADLVSKVETWTDRPLLDKTELKGLYRIEINTGWQPMQVAPFAPGAKQDGVDIADLPTLFEVFERLGLKMETTKGKVDVFVIDHIEKPTEN